MKRLYKSTTNRKIWGVCGGLAEYFDVDATIIRLVLVLLTCFTAGFPGVLVYIIAAIIMTYRPQYEEIIIEKQENK